MKMQLLFFFTLVSAVVARKHHLNIKNDDRRVIGLSTFGFWKGGELCVNITKFRHAPHDPSQKPSIRNGTFGFTLDKTSSSGISPDMEGTKNECMLRKESSKEDDSVSIIYFTLDEENKRLWIESKGSDVKHLKIYYPPSNETRGSEPSARAKRQDQGQNISTTELLKSTAKPVISTTRNVATTKQPVEIAKTTPIGKATPGNEASTSKTTTDQGLLEKFEKFESIYGTEATDSIPVHIDDEGLMYFSFRVLILKDKEQGLYNLYFHNCDNYEGEKESLRQDVNFTSVITEMNGENYLSAGDMPLPAFYFMLCLVYLVLGCLWFFVLKRATEGVFKTHYLMLSFLFVKALSLLFHAIDFHFIKINGHHGEAFAILYYVTYLMKGTLLVVTILLIGAGWSFIKHILSKREKKLFIVVIPLQILANVAQVIIQETEEGTTEYTTWKMIFLMLDLLCCGAILFPVVWSIRHLQEASQTDGKAAINLAKLKIFRHFYILIVCYIYSTRIIAYLLAITLPFQYEWVCAVFREGANIIFFVMTGVKFRPASDNPYLQIPQSDSEEEMEEVLTQSGALEGITRVHIRDTDKSDVTMTTPKQRESSHEYD